MKHKAVLIRVRNMQDSHSLSCMGCRKQDEENKEIKYLKERLFMATKESVLYGLEAWTLTKSLEKQLNGCYTRLLRMVFNVHWKEQVTNEELNGTMMRVTDRIQEHRMWFAGHNIRQAGIPLSKLILWELTHGCASRGRPALSYVKVLKSDAGVTHTEELTACLKERDEWRAIKSRSLSTR